MTCDQIFEQLRINVYADDEFAVFERNIESIVARLDSTRVADAYVLAKGIRQIRSCKYAVAPRRWWIVQEILCDWLDEHCAELEGAWWILEQQAAHPPH